MSMHDPLSVRIIFLAGDTIGLVVWVRVWQPYAAS